MAHPFGERDLVEQTASKEPMTLDSFGGRIHVVEKHARMTHEEANWRLSLTQHSGYSNSFSSGNEGKATRDDLH